MGSPSLCVGGAPASGWLGKRGGRGPPSCVRGGSLRRQRLRGVSRRLPKRAECVRRCGRSDARGRHRRRILASVRDKAAFVAENASLAKPPAGASAHSRIFLAARGGKGAETGPQGFSTAECSVVCARPSGAYPRMHKVRRMSSCLTCALRALRSKPLCDPCAKRTAPCFVSCICGHEAGGGCVRTGFSGRGFPDYPAGAVKYAARPCRLRSRYG